MAQREEFIISLKDLFSRPLNNAARNTDVMRSKVGGLQRQLSGLQTQVAGVFSAFAVIGEAKNIIRVGSTFEQLQISFETMLGSAEKAKVLIGELVSFAEKTPFELQDVSKGAKNLLAFGIAQEKILPTLKALGDVSAGLSVPIERLILNYGQVKAQTKLTGREIRDFAIAGVPIISEVAKVMGVTEDKVADLASKSRISFDVVEQAFKNMSGEGGKFFNLMQRQTASTGGQLSNLTDIIDLLRNDLFIKFQPTINETVKSIQDWIAFLRKNIDTVFEVIQVIGKLIGFYIKFKAVQFALIAASRLWTAAIIAKRIALVALRGGLMRVITSIRLFKVAIATTGIGLVVVALGELVSWFAMAGDEAEKQAKRVDKFGNALEAISAIAGKNIFKGLEFTGGTASQVFAEETSTLNNVKQSLKDLNLNQIESLRLFLQENIGSLQRELINVTDIQKFAKKRGGDPKVDSEVTKLTGSLSEQKKILELVTKELSKFNVNVDPATGKTIGATGAGTNLKSGLATVRAGAPKTFNISIDSLVEKMSFEQKSMKENVTQIRDAVAEVMLQAVNDAQVIAR